MRNETVLRGADIKSVTMNGKRLKDVTGVRFNVPAEGFVEVNLRIMVTRFRCVDNAIDFNAAIDEDTDEIPPAA